VLKTDYATGGFIPHRQLTEELSVFDAEFDTCAFASSLMINGLSCRNSSCRISRTAAAAGITRLNPLIQAC